MKIVEFRIPMPMTLEEYRIGQLFTTTEMSKNETGGGDGVSVLEDRPFNDFPLNLGYNSGHYTMKKYFMKKKANAFIQALAPKGSLEFEEESWNAYPYCKTIVTNPAYMKDAFGMTIETMHAQDGGTQENILHLSAAELRERKVVFVDILDKTITSDADDPDIATFQTQTLPHNRGPLQPGWNLSESVDQLLAITDSLSDFDLNVDMESLNESNAPPTDSDAQPNGDQESPNYRKPMPIMCCYKLVRLHFKFVGIQEVVEKMLLKNQKLLMAKFNKKVFLWMDRWFHLSIDKIREMERDAKDELERQRREGELRGGGMEEK